MSDANSLPISVVVTCRNDPLTPRTVRRALATASNPERLEIIVVEDCCGVHGPGSYPQGVRTTSPRESYGVDAGRHAGLLAATHDTCLLLDAHMDFQAGWDSAIAGHWLALPKPAIASCRMTALWAAGEVKGGEQPTIIDGYGVQAGDWGYSGARIQMTMSDPSYGGDTILQPKWCALGHRAQAASGEPVKIGCVLGAAYVLSKADYHGRLAGCLQYLVSWGWSEQWLSLINWCMGGDAWLLPVRIAHRFQTRQPFPVDRRELVNNQRRCLALPWPPDVRAELEAHLRLPGLPTPASAHCTANGVRSLADYITEWVTPYVTGSKQ